MRPFLLLLPLLIACSAPTDDDGSTPPDGDPPGIEKHADLAYTSPPGTGGELATLDLYLRPDGEPKPLALLVHGGSWVGGDKANFDEPAPDFVPWWVDRGYVVAAVNFRLASPLGQPRDVLPRDQARDIAHALAWLAEQADEYDIAQGQVVAVGYSSGAHLVALLGADGSFLQEVGRPETELAATVSLDVHAYDVPHALDLMVGSVVEQNIPLIEHLFGTTEDEQLAGSPIHYLDGFVAPAMLVSVEPSPDEPGSHGWLVEEAAQHYADALLAEGHVSATFHDSSESHATLATGFGASGDAVTEQVAAFLDAL